MIETILHSHLSRYPAMQIQDLYKLLHQAALGSEHTVHHSPEYEQLYHPAYRVVARVLS